VTGSSGLGCEVVRNAEGPGRGLLVSGTKCWEVGSLDAGILLLEVIEHFLKILLNFIIMLGGTFSKTFQAFTENTFHVIKHGLEFFGRMFVFVHGLTFPANFIRFTLCLRSCHHECQSRLHLPKGRGLECGHRQCNRPWE